MHPPPDCSATGGAAAWGWGWACALSPLWLCWGWDISTGSKSPCTEPAPLQAPHWLPPFPTSPILLPPHVQVEMTFPRGSPELSAASAFPWPSASATGRTKPSLLLSVCHSRPPSTAASFQSGCSTWPCPRGGQPPLLQPRPLPGPSLETCPAACCAPPPTPGVAAP